jgi:ribulose-phosphate 3-epimerase
MKSNFKLAPSILSANFSNLQSALDICSEGGAHWIHVDVMDNQFVPNLTIGPPVVKSLRRCTQKFIDVHMMVVEPEKLVEPFARAGADNITFHYEAASNSEEVIDLIRSSGCKVGISIKPNTSIDKIYHLLDKVDLVLIMSVEPGFGGQGYIESSDQKIKNLKSYLNQNCLDRVMIEVDGGVKLHNAKHVVDLGADILVAGSEVFKSSDPVSIIKKFYKLAS